MSSSLAETSSTSRLSAWLEPHPRLEGIALIDHLFNRLDGLYPHRWRSAFASEQAISNWRETWADGFAEEGVTMAEIKAGMKACRTRFAWPPSFAEFMSACRQPMDFESAFCEAIEQLRRREHGEDQWSHPAIYWASVSIGSFDMRNATWGGIKARWTATLQAELEKREWPDVPLPMVSLPAPGNTSVSPEEAKRRIEEMKESLMKKMAVPAQDGEERESTEAEEVQ